MPETITQGEIEEFARYTRDLTRGEKFNGFATHANQNPKEFPKDFLQYIAPLGYLGMDIPEVYGGSGMSAQMQAAITEGFSRAHAGLGLSVLVANSLAAFPIARFGTEEQKQKYLPRMAAGEIFGCFAITEPNVGSDAKAIEMKAVRDGEDFLIRGSKRFITSASGADICVFDARTGPAQLRGNSISAFVAEIKNRPGVSVPIIYDKVGQPGSVLCEVVFDDLFVPVTGLMNKENKGFDTVIAGTLAHSRVQIAAQNVGIAQSAIDEAQIYGEKRQQSGKYLKDIEGWSNHLAVLTRQVELSRFLTGKAARHEDAKDPNFFVWASLAKLIACETSVRVAEDAMLLHGGIGYIKDMRIGQIVQDALVGRIYEGTAHIQLKILDKFGIDQKKRAPLYPPANMLDLKLEQLPPLEKVKVKVERWKITS